MLHFTPWRPFEVYNDRSVSQAFLRRIGAAGVSAFKDGIGSPKSGRLYRRRGRIHHASAAGEFPAKDSGRHIATIRSEVKADSVTIGSSMYYAKFLSEGTSKMAKRKMSKEALELAIASDNFGVGRFARFRYK